MNERRICVRSTSEVKETFATMFVCIFERSLGGNFFLGPQWGLQASRPPRMDVRTKKEGTACWKYWCKTHKSERLGAPYQSLFGVKTHQLPEHDAVSHHLPKKTKEEKEKQRINRLIKCVAGARIGLAAPLSLPWTPGKKSQNGAHRRDYRAFNTHWQRHLDKQTWLWSPISCLVSFSPSPNECGHVGLFSGKPIRVSRSLGETKGMRMYRAHSRDVTGF